MITWLSSYQIIMCSLLFLTFHVLFINLQLVYFIASFITILLVFAFFIAFVGARLSGNISQPIFSLIEKIIITGMLSGITGMFQPWILGGYRTGFLVLLFSAVIYTVWSHVIPRRE
jgi:hypothetical protein